MKGPGWCQDEVAWTHRRSFAIDCGVCAAAFNDETNGGRCMTMRRSYFSREDQLDSRIETLRNLGNPAKPWICQNQNSSRCLFCGNQAACFQKQRTDVVGVIPKYGKARGLGFHRKELSQSLPERRCVLLFESGVKLPQCCCRFRFDVKARRGIHVFA